MGPQEIPNRANAICASKKFRTGRSALSGCGEGGVATNKFVRDRFVTAVIKFVTAIGNGSRFVGGRFVTGAGTGALARFVGATKFVFSQCKRSVALPQSTELVEAILLVGAARGPCELRQINH